MLRLATAIGTLLLLQDPVDNELKEFKGLLEALRTAREGGKKETGDLLQKAVEENFLKSLDAITKARKASDVEARKRAEGVAAEMLTALIGQAASLASIQDTEVAGRFFRRIIQTTGLQEAEIVKLHSVAKKAISDRLIKAKSPDGYRSIIPPSLPESENAAEFYTQALSKGKELFPDIKQLKEFTSKLSARSDDRIATANEFIKVISPVIELIRKGSERKACRFPFDYRGGKEGFELEPYPMELLTQALKLSALAHSVLGDHSAARKMCTLHARFISWNDGEPDLGLALLTCATIASLKESVEHIFSQDPPPAADVGALEKALKRIDPRKMFTRGFQGEGPFAVAVIEKATSPNSESSWPLAVQAILLEELVPVLDTNLQILDLVSHNYQKTMVQIEAIKTGMDATSIGILTFTPQPSALLSMYKAMAHLTLLEIAVAIYRYHNEHGRIPESLKELCPKYMDQLPIDPYTGDSIGYEGGSVYSVGRNGRKDDSADSGDDIQLRVTKR